METPSVRSVHWFRKGLRLHDNPALLAALRGARSVRCIYILDPWFAASSSGGINRWRSSHYITAPSDIVPGVNTTLAVHLFGANYTEMTVNASIWDKNKSVLVNASGVFYNNTIGLLTIPAVPKNSSSSIFYLSAMCLSQNNVIFNNQITLEARKDNGNIHTFIQTDKIAYKPGQVVKIRVISVDRDLKPYNGLVNISIENPDRITVQQWQNLTTDLGVVSTEFLLSADPMFGSWTIQTKVNNTESIVYFTVTNDVLPKFDVAIQTPYFYVEPTKQNLEGTVTAKNIFGKPINGNVTVSLKTLYYDNTFNNYINKTYPISGSANFSFTYDEILNYLNWGGINVTASVTEEFTGVKSTAYSFIERTDSEYRIIILSEARETTPGLNFTAKMQILRTDNTSLTEEERNSNVTVRIIQSTTSHWRAKRESNGSIDTSSLTTPVSSSANITIQEYTIPENGIINIQFPVIQSLLLLKIEAQYRNTTQNWILDKSAIPTSYASIRLSNSVKKVGEAFEINVKTKPKNQELYYMVMAMGRIVKAGQTTNAAFMLTPEYSWAPEATLIVYFPLKNEHYGEIVQTSVIFFVQVQFLNKVSLSWSKSLARPSENVSLTMNVSKARSLVGLDVTERRPTHKENGNYFTASRVINELSTYNQGLGSSLSDFVVSYSNIPLDELFPLSRGESEFVSPLVPMSTFIPETWLWLETNVSSGVTNNLQLTTPQTNNTWFASAFVISEELGLGFTEEPIEIEVFQPFFILLNQPYSVVRGEQFILEISIFNYLTEVQKVTITIEPSDSFEIIVPNNDSSIIPGQMNVTVPSYDSKIVLFAVRPRKLGQISISVKANSSAVSYTTTQITFVKVEGVKHFFSQAAVFEVINRTGLQSVFKTFSFTFPIDVVHDSEEAFITVVGDLLVPSIDGLEALIQMPSGCGEQNMINFAPNIYILYYLIAIQKLKENTRVQAISFMELGYQRELSYRRTDGSFSAFGNSDVSGSTWLTAFVLRCFLQARPFIFISQDVLDQMVQWLVQYQDINTGIFSEPGRVIHRELQGGLNGPLTLTAYILISLHEDEAYSIEYEFTIQKAVQYIESKFDEGIASNYTLSVVAYALSLAKSSKAEEALTQLNSRASSTGELKYWSSPSETINHWQPLTTNIETAAYALLSHYSQNRISDGIPIMKWLTQQRSNLGGYSSTQDTVMALQALAQFLSVMPTGDTALNVTVTGSGSFVPKTFHINNENLLVLQSQKITASQSLSLNVSAEGKGIAIVQLNINYNQKESSRRKRNTPILEAFTLDITVNEVEGNINRFSVDVCTSYVGTENESGMALLDVGFLSGFTLGPENIPLTGLLKRLETKEDRVYLYFDSINKTQVCVSIPMVRVTNVAGSQDAVVTILDYYNPSTAVTRMYNSEKMKNISLCDYCGFNCSLCSSNDRANVTPTVQTTPQTTVQTTPQTSVQESSQTTLNKSPTTLHRSSATSVPMNSTSVQSSSQTSVGGSTQTTVLKMNTTTVQKNPATTSSTSVPTFNFCSIFLFSLYFILWY